MSFGRTVIIMIVALVGANRAFGQTQVSTETEERHPNSIRADHDLRDVPQGAFETSPNQASPSRPELVHQPDVASKPGGVPEHLSDRLVIQLDVLPGLHPNVWSPGVTKAFHVAIAGSESFDILKIDADTVVLSRLDRLDAAVRPIPSAEPWLTDVTGWPEDWLEHHEDPRPDGILDLQLRFNARKLADILGLWEVEPETLVTLLLRGRFYDGTAFEARDCVMVEGAQPYTSERKRAHRSSR